MVDTRAEARELIRRHDAARAAALDALDPLPLPCACDAGTDAVELWRLSRRVPLRICRVCGRAQNAG